MAVPEVIPIAYEPNQRSGAVGRYADGQFLASVTYAFPQGFRPDDGWEEQKRLYTVLHTFDAAGRYRDSEIWCAGTWAQQQSAPDGDGSVLSQARIHLAKLLRALPRRSYTDIAVRPFQRTVDGVLFGLLVEEDEDGSWAELYPDRHCFGPPWDGSYDS
jgi:formate hydrogenlyase regulatory protein HycA